MRAVENATRAASRDWDAATYDRVSETRLEWALEQLDRHRLRGDEVVVDAGCGTGRVTAAPFRDRVLARLGSPVTIDHVSLNMVARNP